MKQSKYSRKKVTGAHYTPAGLGQFVANKIWEHIKNNIPGTIITVLDPACGDGELLLSFVECVPEDWRQYIKLIGVDTDSLAFQNARSRLQNLGVKSIDLRLGDFLQLCIRELTTSSNTPNSFLDQIDIIIANPPYVRTQVLGAEKSQQLASAFNLSGRVDLYHAFIVAMKHCLKIDGIMGIITSNRFIATKSGDTVRKLLTRDFDILELVDLGDTKLFEAAVLPAVLIARHREAPIFHISQTSEFMKIYETKHDSSKQEFDNIYEALQNQKAGVVEVQGSKYRITSGIIEIPATGKNPWVMVSHDEKIWLGKINRVATCRIADITKVRVGVKTTADEVFIREAWDDLPQEIRPESNLLYPLISSSDTSKWHSITESNKRKKILYTHFIDNGKRSVISLKDYPRATAYFETHRKRLEGRKYVIKANRQWYEIWVPQNPAAWQNPKIVFPDISPDPHFLYDIDGHVVDGNCYWMSFNRGKDEDWMYLILGVANSKLMTRYHDLSFNNKLYAGRRRYLTQYVEKYPLPDVYSSASQCVIKIVQNIIHNKPDEQALFSLEYDLELAVMDAFDVTDIPMG